MGRRKSVSTVEQERRRSEESDESIVRFKLWAVLLIIGGCISWTFSMSLASSDRISRLETAQGYIISTLKEIKLDLHDIKESVK